MLACLEGSMIVDLAKLFPKGSAAVGLKSARINIHDIRYFHRSIKSQIGFKSEDIAEDVINISNETIYRFPALDDGLEILGSIGEALNTINMFDHNKDFLDNDEADALEIKNKDARKFMVECSIKYF